MKSKISFGVSALVDFVNMNFAIAQDTIHKKIKSLNRVVIINAPVDSAFAFMDDIRNTGKHMTESSGAMAGSKLKIEWL